MTLDIFARQVVRVLRHELVMHGAPKAGATVEQCTEARAVKSKVSLMLATTLSAWRDAFRLASCTPSGSSLGLPALATGQYEFASKKQASNIHLLINNNLLLVGNWVGR